MDQINPEFNFRVIPRLDIKGPNLVKGIHMEGLRVLGKPEDFARNYYENGADELYYIDAVASLYERNSLLEIIERTAKEIFIPLCVGGGLRSVEDIRTVLRAGADKVSINTAAIKTPELISQASRAFGSSTIVVSIEAVRHSDGHYECLTDYGRQSSGVDAITWAKQAEDLGAGELIVTSIDQEGTGEGFDLELTSKISQAAGIPVIASGGAGSAEDIKRVIVAGCADAVSAASIFHYGLLGKHKYDRSQFAQEGNVEFLKKSGGVALPANFQPITVRDLKVELIKSGIPCRIEGLADA